MAGIETDKDLSWKLVIIAAVAAVGATAADDTVIVLFFAALGLMSLSCSAAVMDDGVNRRVWERLVGGGD